MTSPIVIGGREKRSQSPTRTLRSTSKGREGLRTRLRRLLKITLDYQVYQNPQNNMETSKDSSGSTELVIFILLKI